MNGAATNENEIALGPFSPLIFSCTLYAGQRSRKIPLPALLNSGVDSMRSFYVSNCVISSPPFAPLLYLSFLSSTLQLVENPLTHSHETSNVDSEASYDAYVHSQFSSLLLTDFYLYTPFTPSSEEITSNLLCSM